MSRQVTLRKWLVTTEDLSGEADSERYQATEERRMNPLTVAWVVFRR